MKIKDGYILRDVAGSHIVVPLGAAELDLGGMMTLNEVGAFVWRALEQETTEAPAPQPLRLFPALRHAKRTRPPR